MISPSPPQSPMTPTLSLASSASPVLTGTLCLLAIPCRRWNPDAALSQRSSAPTSSSLFTRFREEEAPFFPVYVPKKQQKQRFASISSSSNCSTSTFGIPQVSVPSRLSSLGSPLLWIGVGVALSAIFSVVATKYKRKAINEAFKAVMGEAAAENGHFQTAAFSPGLPFPYGAEAAASAIDKPSKPF